MWFILTAQGLLFLAWAFEAFRILFHLTKRGRAASGKLYPGPIVFLQAVRGWLSDPARRVQRLRFFVLTLLLMGLTVAIAIVGSPAG